MSLEAVFERNIEYLVQLPDLETSDFAPFNDQISDSFLDNLPEESFV